MCIRDSQKVQFGCMNTDCCDQVTTSLSAKFDVVTVSCIVVLIYMLFFIVNMQYMLKVIQRYNIRFLNHNGDYGNILTILVLFALLFVAKFTDFEQIGPPLVDFDAIVPKGKEIYSYYDIRDPKEIKEEKRR